MLSQMSTYQQWETLTKAIIFTGYDVRLVQGEHTELTLEEQAECEWSNDKVREEYRGHYDPGVEIPDWYWRRAYDLWSQTGHPDLQVTNP